MELSRKLRAQTSAAGSESVQSPATLRRTRICLALWAPMFWKTGLPPGLSCFCSATRLVDPERGRWGSARPASRMVRSPHNLPKRGVGRPLRERPKAFLLPHGQTGLHEELATECVEAPPYGWLASACSSARGNGEGTASHIQGLTLACVDPPRRVNAPAQRCAYCPANPRKMGKPSCTNGEGGFEPPMDGNAHTGFRNRCARRRAGGSQRVHSASIRFTSAAVAAYRAYIAETVH
jgi:hypothetical protein